MAKVKFTFITTVFNEATGIDEFLLSILKQSILPAEIIIVDGGSTDDTPDKITKFIHKYKIKITLLEKKGNRSVGRNLAIESASYENILCSDAGCILDREWVKNIIKPFEDKRVDVVAGYYKGKSTNVFEKCVVPYALVMPDQVKKHRFLPATRSMAFKKNVWKELNGFDESLAHNEDYAFSQKLVKYRKKIVFVQTAIVQWLPPRNIKSFAKMTFRFALGDAQACIYRPKVGLIYLRYLLLILLIINFSIYHNLSLLIVIISGIVIYLFWAVIKNFKYVNEIQALYILPVLQVISDISIIIGTLIGSTFFLEKD